MLAPKDEHEIPEMTAKVARAAFPKGNAVMKLRDALGILFDDVEFARCILQLDNLLKVQPVWP